MNRVLGMKHILQRTFFVVIFSTITMLGVFAQADVISDAKLAIKAGSSKELIRFCNDMVELKINDESANYSKTQAEFVLKDFFKKFPPNDFQYIHQGSSPEGIKYIIGKYTHGQGSFRVLIYVKQFKGKYLIDLIDFTEE